VAQVFNTYIWAMFKIWQRAVVDLRRLARYRGAQGDFDALAQYLQSCGVTDDDVDLLREALESDEKEGTAFGQRVRNWMAEMVGKAASGVWNIGTSAGTMLLVKALSKYFGWE